ncbi:putative SAM dependent methyltransferase [Colletotrichum truncatum]|uniref:SAM dependent methyltransferase n=1 Tax=Colletotrichum truncatum TaxID=5467 RepID=A0ACC3Z985_COLTU|nr:putative SAM dependent methyltransferase [Colletotrichum truncatum]KAF6793568.1 putative SAM dependent methyltransferase [Colletotrichum truncatum]
MAQETPEIILSLAAAYPHDPKHLDAILVPQLAHRLRLTTLWSIAPSSRVLDIGCGQGDSALVLSHAVAPDATSTPGSGSGSGPAAEPGHVTALDPAPGDYGSPYTLAQSQSYILKSERYGPRITFHQSDAPSYLASHPLERFDSATLCHSLWYFPSRDAVAGLFDSLYSSGRIDRLCFAEYSLKATSPSQVPHELAVEAQRRFHSLREDRGFTLSQSNVRGALDPEELIHLAEKAGWKLHEKGAVETPGMLDGQWEVGAVLAPDWVEELTNEKLGPEAEEELLGFVAKIRAAADELRQKGDKIATMDATWVVMQR